MWFIIRWALPTCMERTECRHLTHQVLRVSPLNAKLFRISQIQSAKNIKSILTDGLISSLTNQRWLSRLDYSWQNRKSSSFPCVTVDVVAVIEVLVIERRTGWHQLLQSHLSDEEAARQVKMLQSGKSSALRQSPETQTQSETLQHAHAHMRML